MATHRLSALTQPLDTLAGEIRKVRSYPPIPRATLWGLVAITSLVAFGVAQTGLFLAAGREKDLAGLSVSDWPILALHFGQIIPILIGAWIFGQDGSPGTKRIAFLATPRRITLVAAKFLTVTMIALVAALACTIGALAPLAFAGGSAPDTIALAPFGWMIGYWVAIAVTTGGLVAATRSVSLSVVIVLVWTIGLSDLLTRMFPILSGVLDQVFKNAYQGGGPPSLSHVTLALGQVLTVTVVGTILYTRRDTH